MKIELGALSDALWKQLDRAGLCVDDESSLDALQADADAATRLMIRGKISDAACQTARKRIVRDLEKLKPRPGKFKGSLTTCDMD